MYPHIFIYLGPTIRMSYADSAFREVVPYKEMLFIFLKTRKATHVP